MAFASMQPHLQLVELGFTHYAGKPEQQPIVVGPRVVHTLSVGDQRIEQTAQLQQLMPIAVVTRQAGRIQADD